MFIEFHLPNVSEIIFAAVTILIILGHNLWLVGENEQTEIRVSANTGDKFPESDSAVKPERVADFRLVSSSGFQPFTNYRIEGHSLVADMMTATNESFCVALALYAHPITLEAVKFAGYINEENAQKFVEPNFVAGHTTAPQRESYAKFAKVLIEVGGAQANDISDLIAGHQFEIVPQIAPSKIGSNRMLPVQVLFEGRPLARIRVSSGCENLNEGKYLSHTTTDESGMAEIEISESGHWFARTHFIRPHPDQENFDWESFWSSVTFRI